MSDQLKNLYADHEQMSNHWWWRPGWGVGTRFYSWHVTFDGQDELHDLIDRYQNALKPIATLDPIPRQWRHLTMQGLGHVDDVSDDQRDAACESVAARLANIAPLNISFQRAAIFEEAIALPPSDPDSVAAIRSEIRSGIADAWGYTPEKADGYRAHISAAYSNGDTESSGIRAALDSAEPAPAAAHIREISLIRMHRDARMYEWETVSTVRIGKV